MLTARASNPTVRVAHQSSRGSDGLQCVCARAGDGRAKRPSRARTAQARATRRGLRRAGRDLVRGRRVRWGAGRWARRGARSPRRPAVTLLLESSLTLPLAEAMRVNSAFERMASSSRPASADAAGITSVPHAALFNDFMPSTCSPLFALRSPPRWARSGAADTPARGVPERIAAAHARSGS